MTASVDLFDNFGVLLLHGYPCGLIGNNIHLDAQIVAVTDVYESLTADRPYRRGLPPYHALEMILAWSGKDFNPQVVQAFRESLTLYPAQFIGRVEF